MAPIEFSLLCLYYQIDFKRQSSKAITREYLKERDGRVPSKKTLQSFLRTPHKIKDVQLQLESIHCAMQDDLQGLITDQLRNQGALNFINLNCSELK